MAEPVQTLRNLLVRPADANKYTFGRVLIIGGSPGMVGAPLLAGEAALRVGAGMVTVASDAHTVAMLEKRVAEIMTLVLPKKPEALIEFIEDRSVTAAAVGPGLTLATAHDILPLLRYLPVPLVIDAGALVALQNNLPLLDITAKLAPVIITPHVGEYQKMSGTKLPADQNKRESLVSRFAQDHHVIVLLKGQHTLVAHPDGTTYRNTTGNPGLATAGTGDVLTGIITGLLAQDINPHQAAEAGVYLHGLAADLAAQAKTQAGLIASDVIEAIPAAFKTLETTD